MAQAATALKHDEVVEEQEHEGPRAVNESSQRRVYGGFNFGAAFFGWLVSIGIAAIITSLLAGAGSAVAFTAVKNVTAQGVAQDAATIGFVSGILLLVALAIAYFAGGYVAGRMSRFDGARQGLGVWILGILMTLLLGAIGAAFGSKYNALQQINLPHIPISQGSFTTAGIVALIITVLITLGAAIMGGKTGERYHRKVDRAGRA